MRFAPLYIYGIISSSDDEEEEAALLNWSKNLIRKSSKLVSVPTHGIQTAVSENNND